MPTEAYEGCRTSLGRYVQDYPGLAAAMTVRAEVLPGVRTRALFSPLFEGM